MKYKAGMILNFKWYDGWLGKLIAWKNRMMDKTNGYTHTAIIGEVTPEYCVVYEAAEKGFVKSNYEIQWLDQRYEEGKFEVGETIVAVKDVKNISEKYLGTPYSFVTIFLIGLYFIMGRRALNFSDGVKTMICSEAICRVLYDASNKKVDFVAEFGKPYDIIEPQDLSKSKQIEWRTN